MDKPDATGAQSLEEILAQIKKSVAGDAGITEAGAAAGAGEDPDSRTTGDSGLSARLAGVLEKTTAGTPPDDDDTHLLAASDTAPTRNAPDAPAAPRTVPSQAADPLWFLRQPAEAAPDNEPAAQMAPTRPEPEAAAKQEEIKLSRPQDLRASLPPLFGAEDEEPPLARMPASEAPPAAPNPPPPGARAKPIPDIFTAKTQPVMPALKAADATADAAAASETAAERAIQPMAVASPIIAQPVSAASPSIAAQRTDPLQAEADAQPKVVTATLQERPAVDPTPIAAAPQARSLEQVVGELLEPVIRQWLEANLPRLVEEVVHKEVARAVAAQRSRSVV